MTSLARFLVIVVLAALPLSAFAGDTNWVEKSNQNAQVVLDILAKFNPEAAGGIGVDGLDEEVIDLREEVYERAMKATRAVIAELQERRKSETDMRVRQDLDILVSQEVRLQLQR